MSDQNNSATKPNKQSFFSSPTHLLILVVVFVGLLALGVAINKSNDKQVSTNINSDNGTTVDSKDEASMSITLKDKKIPEGDTTTVSIWEDSGNNSVNAIQANLTYPADKLEFIEIDTSDSAFEIKAEDSHSIGKILIARGHEGALTGRQLVAKITFKSKQSSGDARVEFTTGTALISSVTNKDILIQKDNANLILESTR